MNKSNIWFAVMLIVLAALIRLVPYPFNFSPVVALALFAGAVVKNKSYAFVLPLAAMLLGDIFFEVSGIAQGFWGVGQVVNYAALALVTMLGFTMGNPGVVKVAGYSVASSLIFFFLSNGSVWLFEGFYPKGIEGLSMSLTAGIPFLKMNLLADLVYSGILFGGFALVAQKKALTTTTH